MIKFDQETAKEKGKSLVELIEDDYDGRAPRMEKIAKVRAQYYGNINRQLRYEGQPNAHVPLVTEKIEMIVPKEMNAFWSAEPHVNVSPIGQNANQAEAHKNEEHLNWAVEADIPDFYQTTEMKSRAKHLDGTAVLKTWYNFEIRNKVMREPVKHSWRAGQPDLTGLPVPADRVKIPEEIIVQALELGIAADLVIQERNGPDDPESVDDLIGASYVVDFVDTDRRLYEGVQIMFEESQFVDEIDVIIKRQAVKCDNVEVDLVDFDHLIVPYRSRNLQDAPRVAHMYWLSLPEIKCRMRRDSWDISDEELEMLKACLSSHDKRESLKQGQSTLDRQQDDVVGEMPIPKGRADRFEPYSNDKLLIFEVYLRDSVEGADDDWSEVIYQIPYALRKVVKANYLEEIFPHERRPFAEFHCIPINGNWYSMSLAEYLEPINIEVDACINLVQEAQEVINNPFFGYVPTSLAMEPEEALTLKPGEGIPLNDPNGLVFPSFPQQPLANLQLVDSLLLFADRLTVSPQAAGSSQVRNAPRTARGTLALLSEAGIKIDSFIMADQKGGWRELINQIHALYAHYGTDEKKYWVTGDPNPRNISRKAMKGRFEYKFSGNSVNTNREVKRTISHQRYLSLSPNPMYQMDLRAQLALIRDYLRHNSEGANVEELLPRLPGEGGTHPPYDQDTENQMMMQLVPVDALPTDDHALHLQKINKLYQSKIMDELKPETVALLAQHHMQHAQMMLAQQQQAAMTPQGANEANNVPQGIALGNMEGGIV